ncbi:putative non-specific serine/threonine protein kinase [Helianthus anomalus]
MKFNLLCEQLVFFALNLAPVGCSLANKIMFASPTLVWFMLVGILLAFIIVSVPELLKPWVGYRLTPSLPNHTSATSSKPQLTPHHLAGPPPQRRHTASQFHLLSVAAPPRRPTSSALPHHKCFVMNEVERAKQKFSPSLKLGEGCFGTVYKAQLLDGQFVAIKRAKQCIR